MIHSQTKRRAGSVQREVRLLGGFSLVELLVALAIVAVLVTLTFAWTQRFKYGAEKVGCLQQLRQVGSNVHRYLADNRMMFFEQGAPGTDDNWIKQIDPEAARIKSLYKCPGDKTSERIERTYRFNSTPGNSGPPYPSLLFGRSYYKIVHPSKKIMVFCVAYSGPAPMPLFRVDTDSWRDTYDKDKSLDGEYPRPHGNDSVNLLFADGHSEVMRYALREALLEGKWIEVLPPERELAEQFKVSRSTLRKALRILEEDGLLVISQGRPTLISVPAAIGVKPVAHRVQLFYAQAEGSLHGSANEGMLWNIKNRLHKAGIDYQEFNILNQATRNIFLSQSSEAALDPIKPLNVLIRVDPVLEKWFHDSVSPTALLIGQGSSEFGWPCVDVDLTAIGAHLASLAVQRGFEKICVLSRPNDTGRAEYLRLGMQRILKDHQDRLTLCAVETEDLAGFLPSALRRLVDRPQSLLVANSPDMVQGILYQAAKGGYGVPRNFSLVVTSGAPDLIGFGVNPAFYEYQAAKIAKAAAQQIVDVMHIDGLKFQTHLFIPNFFPGDTLAPPENGGPARRKSP